MQLFLDVCYPTVTAALHADHEPLTKRPRLQSEPKKGGVTKAVDWRATFALELYKTLARDAQEVRSLLRLLRETPVSRLQVMAQSFFHEQCLPFFLDALETANKHRDVTVERWRQAIKSHEPTQLVSRALKDGKTNVVPTDDAAKSEFFAALVAHASSPKPASTKQPHDTVESASELQSHTADEDALSVAESVNAQQAHGSEVGGQKRVLVGASFRQSLAQRNRRERSEDKDQKILSLTKELDQMRRLLNEVTERQIADAPTQLVQASPLPHPNAVHQPAPLLSAAPSRGVYIWLTALAPNTAQLLPKRVSQAEAGTARLDSGFDCAYKRNRRVWSHLPIERELTVLRRIAQNACAAFPRIYSTDAMVLRRDEHERVLDSPIIVHERVPGVTLATALNDVAPSGAETDASSLQQAVGLTDKIIQAKLALQLVNAVLELHSLGVAHCDLSPSSLHLVSPDIYRFLRQSNMLQKPADPTQPTPRLRSPSSAVTGAECDRVHHVDPFGPPLTPQEDEYRNAHPQRFQQHSETFGDTWQFRLVITDFHSALPEFQVPQGEMEWKEFLAQQDGHLSNEALYRVRFWQPPPLGRSLSHENFEYWRRADVYAVGLLILDILRGRAMLHEGRRDAQDETFLADAFLHRYASGQLSATTRVEGESRPVSMPRIPSMADFFLPLGDGAGPRNKEIELGWGETFGRKNLDLQQWMKLVPRFRDLLITATRQPLILPDHGDSAPPPPSLEQLREALLPLTRSLDEKLKQTYRRRLVPINSDGDCLFNAFRHQLLHSDPFAVPDCHVEALKDDQQAVQFLRNTVVDWLTGEEGSHMLEHLGSDVDKEDFEEFRRLGQWDHDAGDYMLDALRTLYRVQIWVINSQIGSTEQDRLFASEHEAHPISTVLFLVRSPSHWQSTEPL